MSQCSRFYTIETQSDVDRDACVDDCDSFLYIETDKGKECHERCPDEYLEIISRSGDYQNYHECIEECPEEAPYYSVGDLMCLYYCEKPGPYYDPFT